MATQTRAGPAFSGRGKLYLLFAALAVVPLLAFGLGPLAGDDFRLDGAGGPLVAFSAGVLSFVSPCVLPLVPIYITHLSGASVEKGRIVADRRVTFSHAVAFVLGLSAVFIVLGTSVGLLGSYALRDNQRQMEQFAGILMAVMGIVLIPAYGERSPMKSAMLLLALTAVYFFIASLADLRGDRPALLGLGLVVLLAWLKFSGYIRLSFMSRTFGVALGRNHGVGYSRSALVGGAFALGWTPCVGPILSGILGLAASTSAGTGDVVQATYLLAAYSAGLSIPFLIAGLAVSDAASVVRKITPYTPAIEVAAGVMLVALGLLLWYGRVAQLSQYFSFADFNQGL